MLQKKKNLLQSPDENNPTYSYVTRKRYSSICSQHPKHRSLSEGFSCYQKFLMSKEDI